jgi:hypothetical protein
VLRAPPKAGRVVLISEDGFRKKPSHSDAVARLRPRNPPRRPGLNSQRPGARRLVGSKPFAIIWRSHIADNNDNNKAGRPIAKAMRAVTV